MDRERAKLVLKYAGIAAVVLWVVFFTLLYATPVASFIGLTIFFGVITLVVTVPTVILGFCTIADWIENKKETKRGFY